MLLRPYYEFGTWQRTRGDSRGTTILLLLYFSTAACGSYLLYHIAFCYCCCCNNNNRIVVSVINAGLPFYFFFAHFYFPAPGQAVVTGVVPSPARFLPSIFTAHRVLHSHCSSNFHRVLLTHTLALSASQFVHKKKSITIYIRIYTSKHSAGLELTKLTYTRLEDILIRHRCGRPSPHIVPVE